MAEVATAPIYCGASRKPVLAGEPVLLCRERCEGASALERGSGSVRQLDSQGRGGLQSVEEGISSKINDGLYGATFFATSTGGTEKYETGSHIKENTWNSVVELVKAGLAGGLWLMRFF